MCPPAAAAESLLASGRTSEKLSLPALQSKMKCDPEGYESELLLLRNQFDSSLHLFLSDDENQLCTDNTGSDDDEAEDNSVVSDDEESSDSEIGVSDDDDDDVDVEGKEDDLEDSEQSDEEVGEVSEYEEDNDGSVEAKSTLKETSKRGSLLILMVHLQLLIQVFGL
uniref:Uncharacterized protein n=1 Tax=Lotus japonicus TaxID=34305 RepID=I3S0D0_LOTJA|nr:unknown [Lotus japonicus]